MATVPAENGYRTEPIMSQMLFEANDVPHCSTGYPS